MHWIHPAVQMHILPGHHSLQQPHWETWSTFGPLMPTETHLNQLCDSSAYMQAMNINLVRERPLSLSGCKNTAMDRDEMWCGRAGFGKAAGAVTCEKCLLVAQQKQININWLEVNSHSALCHGVYRQVEMQSEVLWALEKRASVCRNIQSEVWHYSALCLACLLTAEREKTNKKVMTACIGPDLCLK